MNPTLLAALNDEQRLLVAEVEADALAALDEDGVVELHRRIRRARNKYVGAYRRKAAKRVASSGGRGKARPRNKRAALKAEAFEEALAVVSARLAVLAHESAQQLREQRLVTARSAHAGTGPGAPDDRPAPASDVGPAGGRPAAEARTGDPHGRTPISKKKAAGTRAAGGRRQGKKDARKPRSA